jgi:excisionase family DNA binding protein
MGDGLADRLAKEFARALPGTLDEETLVALAELLGPYMRIGAERTELLTAADAAKRAQVHVETIRRAVRGGDLKAAGKVGRSVRITTSALDEWLGRAAGDTGDTPVVHRRQRRRPRELNAYSLRQAFEADD